MVLNNNKPYDIESSDEEGEDAWEMIGNETAPLAAVRNPTVAAVPPPATDDNRAAPGAARTEGTIAAGSESRALGPSVGASEHQHKQDGNESFVSAVSSITGDHHTVSDVDEDKVDEEEEDAAAVAGDGDDDPEEEEKQQKDHPASNAADSTEEAQEAKEQPSAGGSFDASLVETLSQMGFERDQIAKAIGGLRESGSEIDADSVIGEMMGEAPPTPPTPSGRGGDVGPTNPFQSPLSGTWDFVESTARDIDERHQLRRRTRGCAQHVGRSARELWSNVRQESERIKSNLRKESGRTRSNLREESERLRSNLRESCDDADVRARDAAVHARAAASSARDAACRVNEEHRIAERVATVAALGGAALLALGNPRAGVGAMAVAGASLAAGEAMRHSSARSGSTTYTGDYGLDEGVHLD